MACASSVATSRPPHWWTRPFARCAAAREARALIGLAGIGGVPALLAWNGRELLRSYIAGAPMQQAQPRHRSCYRDALRLLTRLHRRATGKRLYKLIARRVFGYRDNEGQGRVRD
ncbi:hypothetical protein [Rhodanobacter glycinis]|uniref:hypothetical protein n=1 Tax=Rhodanobacter glycinis TaxID=582702 RepID=UPI001F018E80|nr:hypothetical protein [Rhodanobacter glycinis]